MLGFAPVSSRSISGSPYSLIAVAASIAATASLTLSGSATWGAYVRASATSSFTFSGSATWLARAALSATDGITFSGSALLRSAGRPLVFYALPEQLTFYGQPIQYDFTAQPGNFTFRGMR